MGPCEDSGFYLEVSGSAAGQFDVDLGQRIDIPLDETWSMSLVTFTYPFMFNSLGDHTPKVVMHYIKDKTYLARSSRSVKKEITIPPGSYTCAEDLIQAFKSQLSFLTIPPRYMADLRNMLHVEHVSEKIYISYNYVNLENISEALFFEANRDFNDIYGLPRRERGGKYLHVNSSIEGRLPVQLPKLPQQINIHCDLVENQFSFPKGDSRLLFSTTDISRPTSGIMKTTTPANNRSYKRIIKPRLDRMSFKFTDENDEIIDFSETIKDNFASEFAQRVTLGLHIQQQQKRTNHIQWPLPKNGLSSCFQGPV